jgi:hypothetical protein
VFWKLLGALVGITGGFHIFKVKYNDSDPEVVKNKLKILIVSFITVLHRCYISYSTTCRKKINQQGEILARNR